MHFEHIIQINDLSDELLTPLTRQQLWQGLMRRVEQPEEFLEGVERVDITARGDNWLKREMQLGVLLVNDHITLVPEQRIHFDTAPSNQHQGGSFSMSIEEPAPGQLFVRFSYRTAHPDGSSDGDQEAAKYAEYIKAAYRSTDIDAIRWIRELVETGDLD
jgi:hypothetical protein